MHKNINKTLKCSEDFAFPGVTCYTCKHNPQYLARHLWEGAVTMERMSDSSKQVTRAKGDIIFLVLGVSKLRSSNLALLNLITVSKLLFRCWINPSQQRKKKIVFFSYRATSSLQFSRVNSVIFFWCVLFLWCAHLHVDHEFILWHWTAKRG